MKFKDPNLEAVSCESSNQVTLCGKSCDTVCSYVDISWSRLDGVSR